MTSGRTHRVRRAGRGRRPGVDIACGAVGQVPDDLGGGGVGDPPHRPAVGGPADDGRRGRAPRPALRSWPPAAGSRPPSAGRPPRTARPPGAASARRRPSGSPPPPCPRTPSRARRGRAARGAAARRRPARGVGDGDEDPADAAALVLDRRVGEGPVRLLQVAVPAEEAAAGRRSTWRPGPPAPTRPSGRVRTRPPTRPPTRAAPGRPGACRPSPGRTRRCRRRSGPGPTTRASGTATTDRWTGRSGGSAASPRPDPPVCPTSRGRARAPPSHRRPSRTEAGPAPASRRAPSHPCQPARPCQSHPRRLRGAARLLVHERRRTVPSDRPDDEAERRRRIPVHPAHRSSILSP